MQQPNSSLPPTGRQSNNSPIAGVGRAFGRLPRPSKKLLIGIGGFLALIIVFNIGIMVGNGTISVSQFQSRSSLPAHLNYASVDSVYGQLRNNYDGSLSEEKLLDGLKSGLAQAAGDPYTEYLPPKEAREFNEQLNGSFSGIGAHLGQNDNKALVVVSPISGSPADKAGLRKSDVIAEINGKSTADLSVDEAVTRIRGKKGTAVTLTIVRNDREKLSIKIVRDDIHVPSVTSEVLDNNIGYLRINQFGEDTARLAEEAAHSFEDQGVKGVVLDMRDNPGGILPAAVRVASLWLPEGSSVLEERRGNDVIQAHIAEGQAILQDMPTAVLINEGSASAAEIVAGALRDHDVATLIGHKSYGKGSVQKILPFADGGQLKVTVTRWYRPDGKNIDKKGIEVDKKVPMTEDDYKQQRDPQKDAAIEFVLSR